MKKKLFFSGIISVLLIFAFLVGCDNGTTEYIPGPVITIPVTTAVPGPTVTVPVPGQDYNGLVKALIDAGEAYIKDTEVPKKTQLVPIFETIVVQGNNDVKVPDGVVLEIALGGRLIIEGNAMLYVRETGKVNVKGDLYFEQFANWDDVRQAKIVGEIDVDGGTVYDKTDQAFMLQHVTRIKNSGKLMYSGGTSVAAGHEKFLLGHPTFTGDGYIKMVFSDGWSKYNLVRDAIPANPTTTLLTHVAAGATDPALRGFEVIGNIELTGGSLVLPDTISTNQLAFTVKKGSKLTIGANASLVTETGAQADIAKITMLVVEEGGAIDVDGFLGFPVIENGAGNYSGAISQNKGTITIKETGTLLADDGGTQSPSTILPKANKGKIILKGGAKFLYDRTAFPSYVIFASPGTSAQDIQTNSKTDITFEPDLVTISGDKAVFTAASTWNALPFSLVITGKGADVTFKGQLAGASAGMDVTVEKGGKLTLEQAPTNATAILDGITVTGDGSEIIAGPAGVDFQYAPLLLDNKGKGTFKQAATAVDLAAGGFLIADVTARNGATVSYVGAWGLGSAGGGAAEGYNIIFDTVPNYQAITLTDATLTVPSFTLGGDVSLTNSTVTFPSGIVVGAANTWTLINSTVNIDSMTSAVTGGSNAFSLSLKSTINIKGALTFITATGTPVITLNDVDSRITGASGAKIVVNAGVTNLTINAPGGQSSVAGLEFTGSAPALSTTIAGGKTAQSSGSAWALLP